MKVKILTLGVCGMALALSSCVSTLDGKHKAGWPFAADTVEGRYERSPDQVWQAAKDTLNFNGKVTVENVVGKTLEAKVDTRTVWMLVEPINPNPPYLTRLLTQVRTKGGGTDKRLAAELDKQVAVRLASGGTMPSTPPVRPSTPAPTR